MLTETWLSSKIRNTEVLHCKNTYNFYRSDRITRTGGGVLIAISDRFSSHIVPISSPLEIVCACVRFAYQDVILCVCYRPPRCPSDFCENFHDCLHAVSVRYPNSHIFVMGDFNFPEVTWGSGDGTASCLSAEGNCFLNICNDFNLTQVIHEPTRITAFSSNILDLVFTTNPSVISSIHYLPGLSDHRIVHFTCAMQPQRPMHATKVIKDYAKADYASICTELEVFTEKYIACAADNTVEENWVSFKNKFNSLIDCYVPLRTVRTAFRSPWFTSALLRLRNKKKRLYRSASSSDTTERWAAYHNATLEYKKAYAVAKHSFFSDTLPSLLQSNPRKFWCLVNGPKNKNIDLCDELGLAIASDRCCEALQDVFKKSFSVDNSNHLPIQADPGYPRMEPIIIDQLGLFHLILKMKASAPGIDGIAPQFLKQTATYCSVIFSQLFSQSLQNASLPSDWKAGKVVPVPKPGDSSNPSNYRPITLTSIPCKLLEHIIYSNLIIFLEENNFFHNSQHGFRKHYSCETQLLLFTNDLFSASDTGSIIDCIFLDFQKAFDTVSHRLLLLKLSMLNIDSNTLRWIECFLSNRTQHVTANDHDSRNCSVISGVPQGSVLGPLLFLIYINDLPSSITSTIRLFADDCVIYRIITNSHDSSLLQSDLDNITSWCSLWSMKLNIGKCKIMRISRGSTDCTSPVYSISNFLLSSVNTYKYLGVHIDNNLTWNNHVSYVINNANRTLGFLRRNFSLAPVSLKLLLYKTLVRSKLEYASSIWDPHSCSLVNALEAIQNRSARFIVANYSRTASISSIKNSLDLPTLSNRRKQARLCLFHKIFFMNPEIKGTLFSSPSYVSSRIDHNFKVHVPLCHTNIYFHSYVPKTSSEWNHLPASIASNPDHASFKTAISNL